MHVSTAVPQRLPATSFCFDCFTSQTLHLLTFYLCFYHLKAYFNAPLLLPFNSNMDAEQTLIETIMRTIFKMHR